jgi:hypothetical protein
MGLPAMTMSRGKWLVPFRGRNASKVYNQNFLWRYESVYVMDNHRAAMWCWLRHINPEHGKGVAEGAGEPGLQRDLA